MREIKFRAWDTVIKKYDDRRLVIDNGIVYGAFRHPIIIEQYTGLKDKNGKESYKADIARVRLGDNYYDREIKQAESGAWTISLPTIGSTGEIDFMLYTFDFEIIGNIHEH